MNRLHLHERPLGSRIQTQATLTLFTLLLIAAQTLCWPSAAQASLSGQPSVAQNSSTDISPANTEARISPVKSNIESAWIDVTLRSRFENARSEFAPQIAPAYLDNDFPHIWLDKTGAPGPAAQSLTELVQAFILMDSPTSPHPWLKPYHEFMAYLQQPLSLALPRYLLATDLLYSEMYARLRRDIAVEQFILADEDNDHEEYRYGSAALNLFKPSQPAWAKELRLELSTAALLPEEKRQSYLVRHVKALYPASGQASALLEALTYWQGQTEKTWPKLALGERLDPGMINDEWVPVLIEQLQRLRVLPQDYTPELAGRYDGPLTDAVKAVQQQHGQKVDGIIGIQTRRVLNIPPQKRVQRVAHNFRRLYHLPADMGQRYIMINMADYKLSLVEKNKSSMEMRIIVGSPEHRTPIMKQTLTSVILSPRWNIPKSIGIRSILPIVQKNPEYLKAREIQVIDGWNAPAIEVPADQINFNDFSEAPELFPYRFVQLPGKYNQLGYVKFRLSNNKAIYLHDTPGKHLFDRRERAMSNGCVRLEDALPLASHLLTSSLQGWDNDRIQDVLHSREERYIKVEPYLPVYLMYWTVWQDEQGNIQWRDDIYNKDQLPPEEGGERLIIAGKQQDS